MNVEIMGFLVRPLGVEPKSQESESCFLSIEIRARVNI